MNFSLFLFSFPHPLFPANQPNVFIWASVIGLQDPQQFDYVIINTLQLSMMNKIIFLVRTNCGVESLGGLAQKQGDEMGAGSNAKGE